MDRKGCGTFAKKSGSIFKVIVFPLGHQRGGHDAQVHQQCTEEEKQLSGGWKSMIHGAIIFVDRTLK